MAKKTEGTQAGYEQLKKDLAQKQPGRFYIFYGEEDYLRRHYLSMLRKQLLDELTEDFNYHRLTQENLSAQLLYDSIEAIPMMSERSLVQVDDVDLFLLPEAERNKIAETLSDLPDYCCLVLTYSATEFKPDKRMKKLWDVMQKNAVQVEFRYQSERDLKAWVVRHFRAKNKTISPQTCDYLLRYCGVSMTHLDMEIEKLCAYSEAGEIVQADIDAVAEPTMEAVVFEITDAMGQRDFSRALERLDVMFKLQPEAIPILAAIGNQMRRLNAAKTLMNAGKTADDLAQLYSLAPFAANKTMSQARRLSERFCSRAVLLCSDTDFKLKRSYDDPKRLLEMLILTLAEEARHD